MARAGDAATGARRSARRRVRRWPMLRSRFIRIPFWLTFVFLYLPIVVVVILSFNDSSNLFVWRGFTLDWYAELAGDERIREGLVNTLIVATGSTAIATVVGT